MYYKGEVKEMSNKTQRQGAASIIEVVSPLPGAKAFVFGRCYILVAIENGLWHMSISHPSRYPTWDEIRDARYALVPDEVTMAMLLPPKNKYVNICSTCFHLWEVKDKRLS